MRIKNGEVVGPAGGETGGPHCLAEDYNCAYKAQAYINCRIRHFKCKTKSQKVNAKP